MLLLSRFATARSGLPSPLKSPTATETGRARAIVHRRLEGAIAIAQQHADVAAVQVRHRQIGFAVTIEVTHRHGVRNVADAVSWRHSELLKTLVPRAVANSKGSALASGVCAHLKVQVIRSRVAVQFDIMATGYRGVATTPLITKSP
jgi:hypothetical protein